MLLDLYKKWNKKLIHKGIVSLKKNDSKTYNYPELKKSDILTLLRASVPLFIPRILHSRDWPQDREGAFSLATNKALNFYKVIRLLSVLLCLYLL